MTFAVASALAAFAGAAVQSVSGFGFALLVIPILTVVAGPREAVVTMTAVGVPLVIVNGWRWREDLRRRVALILVGTALVGTPLGVVFLREADDRVLAATVGLVVLVLTVAIWRGLRVPPGTTTLGIAGAVSGALAASVGTNGPPLAFALDAEGLPPEAFRATLQTVFAVEGSIALLTFWATDLITIGLVPAIVAGLVGAGLGALVGDRMARGVDRARFRAFVLLLLAGSGALALLSANPS